MKRIIVLVLLLLALSGVTTASAVAVIDPGGGGVGMPTCNQYTNLMLAQDRNGRWYRCYYWFSYGYGTWVAE